MVHFHFSDLPSSDCFCSQAPSCGKMAVSSSRRHTSGFKPNKRGVSPFLSTGHKLLDLAVTGPEWVTCLPLNQSLKPRRRRGTTPLILGPRVPPGPPGSTSPFKSHGQRVGKTDSCPKEIWGAGHAEGKDRMSCTKNKYPIIQLKREPHKQQPTIHATAENCWSPRNTLISASIVRITKLSLLFVT